MAAEASSHFSSLSRERGPHHASRSISPLSRDSASLNEGSYQYARLQDSCPNHVESDSLPERELPTVGDDQHERVKERQQQVKDGLLHDHQRKLPMKGFSALRRSLSRGRRFATDWWTWELCAILTSLISLAAIVLVLLLHEGRPLPDWPWSITINSLVSIFATIMSGTMLVPVAAGIGQAKWHWFQTDHALSDIEIYDQASRGPWGALKMVWQIRWRHISTLGALVTVLAIAINPFVQQVVVYQLEQAPSPHNATLPVGYLVSPSLAETKGPVYLGLFGMANYTQTPYCPSTNCTWSPYQTLAVCNQCAVLTDHVNFVQAGKQVPSCNETIQQRQNCSVALPNGLSLDFPGATGDDRTLNASGSLPAVTLDSVGYALANFSMIQAQSGETFRGSITAIECSLFWCVNTYTARVYNTVFNESLERSWHDASTAQAYGYTDPDTSAPTVYYNITPPSGGIKSHTNINRSKADVDKVKNKGLPLDFLREDYIVLSATSQDYYLRTWLGGLLSGNATLDIFPDNASGDVIELFEDQDLKNMTRIFDRLARYLTVSYRETAVGSAQALGIAWESQTIVRVRWKWLSLPCALVAASLLFLGAAAVESTRARVPLWKSNALALVFHGPRELSEYGKRDVAAMEQSARTLRARMTSSADEKGVRLVII